MDAGKSMFEGGKENARRGGEFKFLVRDRAKLFLFYLRTITGGGGEGGEEEKKKKEIGSVKRGPI